MKSAVLGAALFGIFVLGTGGIYQLDKLNRRSHVPRFENMQLKIEEIQRDTSKRPAPFIR